MWGWAPVVPAGAVDVESSVSASGGQRGSGGGGGSCGALGLSVSPGHRCVQHSSVSLGRVCGVGETGGAHRDGAHTDGVHTQVVHTGMVLTRCTHTGGAHTGGAHTGGVHTAHGDAHTGGAHTDGAAEDASCGGAARRAFPQLSSRTRAGAAPNNCRPRGTAGCGSRPRRCVPLRSPVRRRGRAGAAVAQPRRGAVRRPGRCPVIVLGGIRRAGRGWPQECTAARGGGSRAGSRTGANRSQEVINGARRCWQPYLPIADLPCLSGLVLQTRAHCAAPRAWERQRGALRGHRTPCAVLTWGWGLRASP